MVEREKMSTVRIVNEVLLAVLLISVFVLAVYTFFFSVNPVDVLTQDRERFDLMGIKIDILNEKMDVLNEKFDKQALESK